MKIQDALIAWNSPLWDHLSDRDLMTDPRIIVVEKTDPFPLGWSHGYQCTNGACCADWKAADEKAAALEILIMFRRLALQGIPALDIHHAFYGIDGYRRAGGWDMLWNGSDFNP